MTGASEFFDLADDFDKAAAQMGSALYDTFDQAGEEFAEDWRRNATRTSGEHGKHYPKSITSETRVTFTEIVAEVGPETRRRQGGMGPGFELGSRKQPPHLDGLGAMGPAAERLEKAADATIGFLLP